MIINTGSRTDIPAYFSEWFYNRIREGYVLARNPYYPQQVTRLSLSPQVVDCICFCTKNPGPMLDRLDELDAYGQFWFVTITPYGKDIEPGVPDKTEVIRSFQRLSGKVGKHAVGWRYDPIFLTEKYTLEYHLQAFEQMSKMLCDYTEQCVISFIDLYEKTKKNFPGVRAVSLEDQERITASFVEIAKQYGIKIFSCLENESLARLGVDASGCMTQKVIERAIGQNLAVPKSLSAAREGCKCLLSNDIGMYNTCGHGCRYCYANFDMDTVRKNMALHDPTSPLLIGHLRQEDVVKEAKQQTYIDGQMRLF